LFCLSIRCLPRGEEVVGVENPNTLFETGRESSK
jgi:hypothetical protein